jgi:hypothetical protein
MGYRPAAPGNYQRPKLITTTVVHSFLQPRDSPDGKLYTDYSIDKARMYVPSIHRHRVFNGLHGQAHDRIRATFSLIKSRYCWPDMNRKITHWTRYCKPCQRAQTQDDQYYAFRSIRATFQAHPHRSG